MEDPFATCQAQFLRESLTLKLADGPHSKSQILWNVRGMESEWFSDMRLIHLIFETRYESNFVCPTKMLSQKRLSEGIPFKNCANPQAHDQNVTRANLYENEMA